MATGGGQGGVAEEGRAFMRPLAPAGGDSLVSQGFTAEDFRRLADSWPLSDARAELIGGEIVKVSPQHLPHLRAKKALVKALERAVAGAALVWSVDTEGTVAFADDFHPLPDVIVWDENAEAYDPSAFIPGPAVKLICEVSASTLASDLGRKLQGYARAGVPEYWVADLEARRILQHADPAGDAYGRLVEQSFGAAFPALALPFTIDTSALADLRTE